MQQAIINIKEVISLCSSKPLFLCGDFNIDFLKGNAKTRKFNDFIIGQELVPVVSQPTRITPNSKTQIDNIFTNRRLNVRCGILFCAISDHLAPFLGIGEIPKEKKSVNVTLYRNTSPKNIGILRSKLRIISNGILTRGIRRNHFKNSKTS